MTARTFTVTQKPVALPRSAWVRIGLQAAIASILAVLLTKAIILAVSPDLGSFKPLDSNPRAALFTLIPAIGATAVFAWLAKNKARPVEPFLWISGIFMLLSFIPDFLLPIPNRSLAGSSAAAFMHVIAGIVIVAVILAGYARHARTQKAS